MNVSVAERRLNFLPEKEIQVSLRDTIGLQPFPWLKPTAIVMTSLREISSRRDAGAPRRNP
jgi:hypothetical protein